MFKMPKLPKINVFYPSLMKGLRCQVCTSDRMRFLLFQLFSLCLYQFTLFNPHTVTRNP